MHADYGKQVGQAFAAVFQLHKDVSRLLMDTLARLKRNGREAVWANYAFDGMSSSPMRPDQWMPYAVCLPTCNGDLPKNVYEVLMVHFWDESPKPQEPHLVLARVTYRVNEDGGKEPAFWDGWDAWTKWDQPFPVGVVNRFDLPDHDRVQSVAITAVPLFDINSVDDVLKHLEKVRERAAQG